MQRAGIFLLATLVCAILVSQRAAAFDPGLYTPDAIQRCDEQRVDRGCLILSEDLMLGTGGTPEEHSNAVSASATAYLVSADAAVELEMSLANRYQFDWGSNGVDQRWLLDEANLKLALGQVTFVAGRTETVADFYDDVVLTRRLPDRGAAEGYGLPHLAVGLGGNSIQAIYANDGFVAAGGIEAIGDADWSSSGVDTGMVSVGTLAFRDEASSAHATIARWLDHNESLVHLGYQGAFRSAAVQAALLYQSVDGSGWLSANSSASLTLSDVKVAVAAEGVLDSDGGYAHLSGTIDRQFGTFVLGLRSESTFFSKDWGEDSASAGAYVIATAFDHFASGFEVGVSESVGSGVPYWRLSTTADWETVRVSLDARGDVQGVWRWELALEQELR